MATPAVLDKMACALQRVHRCRCSEVNPAVSDKITYARLASVVVTAIVVASVFVLVLVLVVATAVAAVVGAAVLSAVDEAVVGEALVSDVVVVEAVVGEVVVGVAVIGVVQFVGALTEHGHARRCQTESTGPLPTPVALTRRTSCEFCAQYRKLRHYAGPCLLGHCLDGHSAPATVTATHYRSDFACDNARHLRRLLRRLGTALGRPASLTLLIPARGLFPWRRGFSALRLGSAFSSWMKHAGLDPVPRRRESPGRASPQASQRLDPLRGAEPNERLCFKVRRENFSIFCEFQPPSNLRTTRPI